MGTPATLTLLFLGSYLLGSVPVGVLIARAKGVDLTQVGSGNVGATNVNRALGRWWGIGVFGLDMTKGLVPTLVARALIKGPVGPLDAQPIWFLAGIAAVLGHAKSPFLRFKGGKGISTSMGAGLGAAPLVALSAFVLFTLVLWRTRYMSLASIIAVSSTMGFGAIYPGESLQMLPLYLALWSLIVWLHRENIKRLRSGTERRFEFVRRP